EEEAQQKLLSENNAAHGSDIMNAETSEQKAEQELLKEEVKNLIESQHHVIKTQEDMNSKLDAILAFMSKKP
ncbi:hypothetical protein A2U01_0058436, partial [Trifolium medium]|nr:hypothetical protein [Trifolium medium]